MIETNWRQEIVCGCIQFMDLVSRTIKKNLTILSEQGKNSLQKRIITPHRYNNN